MGLAAGEPQGLLTMKALQPLLQEKLAMFDPWLDSIFPVATALICAKQRLAGYSLLAVYLLVRLLQRSDAEPWRWVLISLLVINAGLIIEDRDLKPGGTSDYLVVALSFSAGLQRNSKQWQRSIAWIASCAIPLLALSLAAGDQLILFNTASFTGFNINRIGFLAGLITVAAYALSQRTKDLRQLVGAYFLLAAAAIEAILTQSRAAIAVPVITIAADQLSKISWRPKKAIIAIIAACVLCGGAFQLWYGGANPANQGNRIADSNRVATIVCWIQNTSKTSESLIFGNGYGKSIQKKCGPDRLPALTARDKPLAHAHNLYIQVFGETGLLGLILFAALTIQALRQAWGTSTSVEQHFTKPLTIFLVLMAMGATWHSMLLNQVLMGYSLSALTATDRDPFAADAATPATQPGASAPQG